MREERIKVLKEGEFRKGPVAYWMSRDQRIRDNWALIFAQELAIREKSPLIVVFCLAPQFLNATMRHYAFMFSGLEEVAQRLKELKIHFVLLDGEPEDAIPKFADDYSISSLVTDFDPLRIKRQWKEAVTKKISIPFYEVDAHNIVPCWSASPKQEYGAYTIRKKIEKALPLFLDDFPELHKHPFPGIKPQPRIQLHAAMESLNVDDRVKEVDWIIAGEKNAGKTLQNFVAQKLEHYERARNDPNEDGQSNLSPYLHFGQLSAQRVALTVEESNLPDHTKTAFLEELIIRRELSDNFCLYNPCYDSFEGFPEWSKKTLDDHRNDRRPYLYTLEEFETGQTHDALWNAAQMEMVKRGKMHGYMRMYWAKKILEWTSSPEAAMETAIYLNDRYELDGRDPNGYVGIAWSIGGVHDRAWGGRNVFGKIRYMSYNGCKSKFNVKNYIEQVNSL